ncbi:MAG: CoA transferase [Acidimicrobiia bacterium]|nr:CoA transferase [Acidimicrobiia bacterium]
MSTAADPTPPAPQTAAGRPHPVALLEGIRVLDFTQALSGPTLTRYLGELGADVVKVEVPPGGDITRRSQAVRDGRSGYFVSVNRGKRSICVDLKTPEGRELVTELVPRVDVLVENFSPGTIDRLGFGWEAMSRVNPRLVMCSISGFGQTGPLSHLPGYDGVAQAYSGVTSMNGELGGPPIVAGAAVGDVLTGVNAVAAVLGALFWRERTGQGQHVAVSLLDAYLQAHDSSLQSYSVTGGEVVQTRSGRFHPMACPYGIFATVDGYLFICAAADRHWRDVCAAMGRPDLAESTHPWGVRASREAAKDEVNAFVETWLLGLPSRQAAFELLERHRVPVGPVHSIDEVATSDALRASGSIRTASDPVLGAIDVAGFPLRFSGAAVAVNDSAEAPFLGEHNHEVLVGLLGIGEERYDELVAGGVVSAEAVLPRPSRQRPLLG